MHVQIKNLCIYPILFAFCYCKAQVDGSLRGLKATQQAMHLQQTYCLVQNQQQFSYYHDLQAHIIDITHSNCVTCFINYRHIVNCVLYLFYFIGHFFPVVHLVTRPPLAVLRQWPNSRGGLC
jgi:hypothetical protein